MRSVLERTRAFRGLEPALAAVRPRPYRGETDPKSDRDPRTRHASDIQLEVRTAAADAAVRARFGMPPCTKGHPQVLTSHRNTSQGSPTALLDAVDHSVPTAPAA